MSPLDGLGLAVAVIAIVQFARRGGGRAVRRRAEQRAAAAPIPPRQPARSAERPAERPAPSPPRPPGVARVPQRAEFPPVPLAPNVAAAARPSGPRWAINAVIAAEIFGPPVAVRPGGTLGPPNAS